MKRMAVVLACLLIGACAHILQRAMVRDRSTAIELAKKACNWDQHTATPSEHWQARSHGGLWHVWLATESGDTDEPICCEYHRSAALDIWIRADTGKSAGCSVVRKPIPANEGRQGSPRE
jgi:hypothetical protein